MSTNADDIAQLSATQQEALQTYTSVTDQDPIAAIPLLRRAEWNVQIAITRFFEGEPTTDLVAEAQAAIPQPSSRQTTNLQYESLLAASRPSPRLASGDIVQRVDTTSNTLPQYRPGVLLSILLTPFNVVYRVLSTILSPFSFLVPGFINRLLTNLLASPRPNRRYLPPAETAHRFIREFNEEYPSDTSLPWVESGFNLSLDTARQRQKFFLVVLLSPSHDDTRSYVHETLQTSTFHTFLQSHSSELILWGGNIQDPEAYQVSTNLSCTKFPFAALICQTPSSPSSGSAVGGNMTVVSRLVGPMPASELVAKLGTAMTSHQAALRTARAAQAEQQASRNLRQEQDSAYERSLAQDRERTRKKKEEEEARANAEKEALRMAEQAESSKRKREQWRKWKARTIPAEPGPEVKDAVRVSIRMTDGQRVIRKFEADNSLEELYAFVECCGIPRDSEENITEEPSDYKHEYKFRLVSPMPRTVYWLDEGGSIAARIGKSANLIVELTEDEDGDGQEGEV